MVDLVGSYQFDDQLTEGGDVFARDPYILRFRCLNTGRRHNFSVDGEFFSVPHSKSGSVPWHSESHVFFSHDHHSAEGPGDDPRPHKTRWLRERAGWALWRLPECQEEVEDGCEDLQNHWRLPSGSTAAPTRQLDKDNHRVDECMCGETLRVTRSAYCWNWNVAQFVTKVRTTHNH